MKPVNTDQFRKSEDGALSLETVLTVPILVWAITATFVFWDAFKTLNVSQKATYAVADMISREEVVVTDDYVTSMHEIFDFLAGGRGENALRVSLVTTEVDPVTGTEDLALLCSKGSNAQVLTDVEELRDRLPTITAGEHIIVVESAQKWSPAFAVGLASYQFKEVALSRPRFSPNLIMQGCNEPPTT